MKLYLRKAAAFLAAVSMTASTMLYYPANTFAGIFANASALGEQTEGVIEYVIEPEFFADLPDSEELFAGYVDKVFYDNGGVSAFSVGNRTAGSRLTGDAGILYRAISGEIKKIASGEKTSTIITIGGLDGITPDEPFTGSLNDLYNGGLLAALNALLLDYPYEMYWFDKTTGMGISGLNNSTTGIIYSCTVNMPVAKAYSKNKTTGSYVTDGTLTAATSTAVATANSIVEKYAGYLDHKKLEGYKKEICDLVSYNSDVVAPDADIPYGDPWQMIYVFDKNPATNVVCEGYSKAFQYLCDRTAFFGDVSCYCISGTLTGGHMWNIVTMEDGKNYLVDLTNSDEDTVGGEGGLFLAGTRGSVAAGYTFDLPYISLTYKYDANNPWGTDILTLADSDYVWSTISGDVVLNEDVTIGSGKTLTILDGATLTIPEDVNFVNNGVLDFYGEGQQLFGDFTGSGSIYVDGVPHIHDLSGNPAYTKISGDDQYHLEVGACLDCPLGYVDSEGTLAPHTFDENGFCTACDAYEPADSTSDGYGIGNAGQLYWFADRINNSNDVYGASYAYLTSDIVVNPDLLDASGECGSGEFRKWISIGNQNNPFSGGFNGNGHVISGLYFNRSAVKVGFFGWISSQAVVSNTGIVDSYFYGGANTEAGGLVSRNYGRIQNCYVMATVTGNSTDSGGLCGRNYGSIANCYFSGAVTGADRTGALCGRNYQTLQNCYFNSDILSADAIGFDDSDDIAEDVAGKTEDAFASGEVSYLLQGEQEDAIWGQKLETDAYPRHGGDKVYRYEKLTCGGTSKNPPEYLYSNDSTVVLTPETHVFDVDGFCETCGAYESAEDSDGNGLFDIYKAGHLMWWNQQVQHDMTLGMELKADITLPAPEEGESNWTAFGTMEDAYCGTIDGGNHTISGLVINTDRSIQGLVGSLGNGGVIKALTLHDVQIVSNSSFVGAFAGTASGGSIENCHVTGESCVQGYGYVGGIVGFTENEITRCTNAAAVIAKNATAGGIAGTCASTSIIGCENTGSVSASSENVGGIVGQLDSVSFVIACTNSGTVTGAKNVGGIAGHVWSDAVIGSYQTGLVQSIEAPVGAIAGFVSEYSSVSGSYWIASSTAVSEGYTAAVEGIGTGQEGAAEVDGTNVTWAAATVGMNTALAANEYPEYWGMDLANDILPSIDGMKVYAGYQSCTDTELSYSNTEFPSVIHTFSSNGFCTQCDAYEPAVLNDESVFEISNAGMLYWFAEYVNSGNTVAEAVLTSDITMNETEYTRTWTPIGAFVESSFMGTFDGQNYTISGLYMTEGDFAGLFGYNAGTIEKLCLKDFDFSGGENVGGICGNNLGLITNCAVFGTISAATAGGICGSNQNVITNCFAAVNTENSAESAGFCYTNDGGLLHNCFFDTEIGAEIAVFAEEGTISELEGMTSEELSSGIAAYLLDQIQAEHIWGQTIGTDAYPVLGGKQVYCVDEFDCPSDPEPNIRYSNVEESIYISDVHLYKYGECTVCGDVCVHSMDEGSCMYCDMHEGIIKNMDFPTEYAYGDVIDVRIDNFISNSDITQLAWSWYDADESFMGDEIPTEPGDYMLSLSIPEVHEEDAAYTEASLLIEVTIVKADPEITPMIEDKVYQEGDAIPDISLPPDSVSGIIEWIHSIRQLAAGENSLAWLFTPTDDERYNAVTGTAVIVAETTTTTTTTTTPETTTTTTTTTTPETTTTTTTTTPESTTTTTTTTPESTTTTTTTTPESTTTTTTTTPESTTTTTTTTPESTTTTTTTTPESTTTTTTTTPETTTTTTTTTTPESTTTTTTTTPESTTTTTTTTPESTTTTTSTTPESTTTTTSTTPESTTTTTSTTPESTTTTTTTTPESTTTTTSTTPESTTTTTTTTPESTTTTTTSIVGYTYSVETKAPQFYFSDDDEKFRVEELIESITRYAVYSDGTIAEEGESVTDLGIADFDDMTPEILYSNNGCEYYVTICITDAFGVQKIESTVKAYIGVKGDANMDGTTDAKDAAEILVYAAAVGAGQKASLYSETDETLERFANMLADVNGTGDASSSLDATDAAAILVYAAASGSGKGDSWEEILGAA